MDIIIYYFIGLLTGVSVTTFFVGKELYKYYTKSEIQQKQLDRILKFNDEVNKFKILNSIESQNLSIAI
jgi:hypothetical protein